MTHRAPVFVLSLFAFCQLGGCAQPLPASAHHTTTTAHDMKPSATTNTVCGTCIHPTPVCDTQTKQCVECLTGSDCDIGQTCNGNLCLLACSAEQQCGDAGVCNLDRGICQGCTSDAQCAASSPANPFCDLPSGRCVPCSTDNDQCPTGQYCTLLNGVALCQPGCKADTECMTSDTGTPTTLCCGHACDETATSLVNCGSCGNACPEGNACCSATCADVNSDTQNCGACGNACNLPNATSNCNGGSCAISACQNGYGDCDGNALNGCENSLDSSDYCGDCNTSCVFFCVGGTCIPF